MQSRGLHDEIQECVEEKKYIGGFPYRECSAGGRTQETLVEYILEQQPECVIKNYSKVCRGARYSQWFLTC